MGEGIEIGDVVQYRGSIEEVHGYALVVEFIPNPYDSERGYTLWVQHPEWGTIESLLNVHRDSFLTQDQIANAE